MPPGLFGCTCEKLLFRAHLNVKKTRNVICTLVAIYIFAGYQSGVFERSMSEDLQPVLDAATSMVVKTGYALLCVIVIMLLVHVLGAVLFHFLRTRHMFPVHRVFISTTPPVGGAGPGAHGHHHHHGGGQAHHPHPPKDSDSDESEDDNDGFKTYTSQRGAGTLSHPSHQGLPPPAETLLPGHEFQYSETKV